MEEFDSVGTYADIVNSSSDPKKVMRKIRKNMRLLKPVLSVVKSKYTSPEIERLANLYEELSKIQFKDLVTA